MGDKISQTGSVNIGKVSGRASIQIGQIPESDDGQRLNLAVEEILAVVQALEQSGYRLSTQGEVKAEDEQKLIAGLTPRQDRLRATLAAIKDGAADSVAEIADDPRVSFLMAFLSRHIDRFL